MKTQASTEDRKVFAVVVLGALIIPLVIVLAVLFVTYRSSGSVQGYTRETTSTLPFVTNLISTDHTPEGTVPPKVVPQPSSPAPTPTARNADRECLSMCRGASKACREIAELPLKRGVVACDKLGREKEVISCVRRVRSTWEARVRCCRAARTVCSTCCPRQK